MQWSIEIRAHVLDVLRELAQREHRTPREQAAWLLEKALEEVRDKALWAQEQQEKGSAHGGEPESTDR